MNVPHQDTGTEVGRAVCYALAMPRILRLALFTLLILLAPAAGAADPPIRYHDTILAKPLSPELRARVLEVAKANQPKDTGVWFIHVRCNYYPLLTPTEHVFKVSIYYTPSVTTPRLRRGQRVIINDFAPKGTTVEYVDVSPPDAPFDKAAPAEPPAVVFTPFAIHDNRDAKAKAAAPFSDQDTIHLADFARPIFAKMASHPSPLRFFRIHENGTILIWTGSESWGYQIEVKRVPDGFERTDKGTTKWRS